MRVKRWLCALSIQETDRETVMRKLTILTMILCLLLSCFLLLGGWGLVFR